MKISIVGTVGIPANYGGFETLAENLVNYLDEKYQFVVFCSSKYLTTRQSKYKNADLVYIPLKANGVQSTPYDIISIFKAIVSTDILLILGVSGCICLPFIKMISRKKLIVHIDGLEWKREKWGALAILFLKYSEKCGVKYGDTIIADNMAIKKYIEKEYQKDSVLIEYGGDHVVPESLENDEKWILKFPRNSYAVKVCRIEPENNVDLVLEAFSTIKSIPLVMIGNWSYSVYGQDLKKRYGNDTNIELLDPIYEQRKLNMIRSNAVVCIHGHSAGGTNPSLVEAMYLGLPIIAFDAEYNRETTKNKAKYFQSKEDLLSILDGFESLDLQELGVSMKDIALKNYKWNRIADEYAKLFCNK